MKTFLIALLLSASAALPIAAAVAQTSQPPAAQLDPAQCGAGGMGCTPDDVRKWMEKGNELADLSNAALSQYAYACAQHPDWKNDCETDPAKVLKRLGITDYQ